MKRRSFLTATTGALGAAVAAGATRAQAAAPVGEVSGFTTGKVQTEFVNFDDPIDEFEAHFRFERDLVQDQGEALSWYYWLAFIIPENSAPQPLVRFEGMEYSYFRKVADHTYRIHAHNVSYPRSIETNEFCAEVRNPVTGEMIEVEPTILLNDPGTVHSLKGFRNLNGDGSYVVPYKQFRRQDGKMILDSIRTAPPDWPVRHMESSAIWVPEKTFDDKTVTNLLFQTTGMYVFPYPEWAEMGDRGGNMLGFFDGRKIAGVHEFPDEFHDRVKREYPELLKPRWEEFDRPAPFEY